MNRLKGFMCCVALLALQPAVSGQLAIGWQGSNLRTVLAGVAFPARLPQDLKSGLTNTLLIRLALLRGSRVEAQSDILLAVRYDLWDEVFSVTETAGSAVVYKEELGSIDQVMAFLSRIPVPDVFALEKRPAAEAFQLRAQILLNPIEKERLDNLRKWVEENAGTIGSVESAAPSTLGTGVGAPAGAPVPNSLFNRILRGYSGSGASATWLENVESKTFTVKELAHDGE